MATLFKKYRKQAVPTGAEILFRKRDGKTVKVARWEDGRGTKRSADLHEDGQHVVIESNDYYARYIDANGIERRPSTGCSDKQAAEQVLRDLIAEADGIRSGIVTQETVNAKASAKQPIGQHVEAYITHLRHKTTRGRRTSPVHAENVERQLNRLVKDCGIARLPNFTKAKIERWMRTQEDTGKMAGRTINTHRNAAVAFCRWCASKNVGRLASNPLEGIYSADETEKRRQRRPLTEQEIARLLQVTQTRPLVNAMTVTSGPNKGKQIAKINAARREQLLRLGEERALTFETMIYSGLRLSELSPMKVSDAHLDVTAPFLEIRSSDAKDAKTDQVAIPPHLAAKINDWVKNKLPGARLFNVPKGLRKILYRDLALAGIQKLDDRGRPVHDDQGRIVDVHALRHTTGTQLAKNGVLPQVASKQMRHSSLDMTMRHYTHLAIEDKSKAVERLPVYDGGFGMEEARKTGTDCADVGGADYGAEVGAESGAEGGDGPQARNGNDCHKGVTGKKWISEKQPLEGSVEGTIGITCHQKSNCPRLESNQHDPKVTSPSS